MAPRGRDLRTRSVSVVSQSRDVAKLVSVGVFWEPGEPECAQISVQGSSVSLPLTRRDLAWLVFTIKRVQKAELARRADGFRAAMKPFLDLQVARRQRACAERKRQEQWI